MQSRIRTAILPPPVFESESEDDEANPEPAPAPARPRLPREVTPDSDDEMYSDDDFSDDDVPVWDDEQLIYPRRGVFLPWMAGLLPQEVEDIWQMSDEYYRDLGESLCVLVAGSDASLLPCTLKILSCASSVPLFPQPALARRWMSTSRRTPWSCTYPPGTRPRGSGCSRIWPSRGSEWTARR